MLEELLQKEKESLHISLNNVTRKGDIGVALPFICMGAGASRKAQLPSKVVVNDSPSFDSTLIYARCEKKSNLEGSGEQVDFSPRNSGHIFLQV